MSLVRAGPHYIGCHAADVFAAVAPASFDLLQMPITFLGAQACFDKWTSIDGCTDSASSPQTTGKWQCQYHTACSGGVQVGLCIDPNGGHEYGDGTIGWHFLKQFTLP